MSPWVALTLTVGSQKERSQPVKAKAPKTAIAKVMSTLLAGVSLSRAWLAIRLNPISEGSKSL